MKILFNLSVIILINYNNIFASHDMIYQVWQPNIAGDGIVESISTYSEMTTYTSSSKLIQTVAENCIGCKGNLPNRNLAYIFNLKVRMLADPSASMSDTIKAELTIPDSVNVKKEYDEYSMDQVVKATVSCLIKNSEFHNYLYLKIAGSEKFSKYEKVYPTNKIKYSLQVKAFPFAEYDDAISYYNSLKEIGLMVYLEHAVVKNENYIRVKIGYFDTKHEAYLAANLIKKFKDVEYFLTECNFRSRYINRRDNIIGVCTASGIWAMNESKTIELYDFTKNGKISFELNQFTTNNNALLVYDPKGYQIDLVYILDKLTKFNDK